MRLTAWEEERLLIFSAAQLARRHRERGLLLNSPEAIALICDAMLEAARGDAAMEEIEAAGRGAVKASELLPGVAALVDEVRLEVLVGDGTRLVVLVDPFDAAGSGERASLPGAIVPDERPRPDPHAGLERRTLEVRSTSTRVIHVSSHMPFDRVNARLEFDRSKAEGFRLDLPAGASERWASGETKTVTLVRYGGRRGAGG
ncbi:MAG TPA: urease subunit gamma [Candidatus Polarisedimenticolia bacterium]|nr:urease subunit gamma [Candidatus Polarisedimenticolia bacterium]